MSNYMKIKKYDIANGEGIRTSIFFSGCHFHCKGCFNKEAWDFEKGKFFSIDTYETEIKPSISNHVSGISILGGEPLHHKNISSVVDLILFFKSDFPDKDIWLWTGYTWEELMSIKEYLTPLEWILPNVDVIVDGQFIEEQKDLDLKWRGSKNQRVIDVKKSLENKEVVLYKA